jgi:hypothetical protein
LPFPDLAGFSRASISLASRAMQPTMRSPSVRLTRSSCIRPGSSLAANSAKARENVASLGTSRAPSQPQMRRKLRSIARRSITAAVVGKPSTALATKARASARRSSGLRPRPPRGGDGT